MIVLDAAHFVPQSRPRLFLFGVERELAEKFTVRRRSSEILGEWSAVVAGVSVLRPKAVLSAVERNAELRWGAHKLPPPPVLNASLADVVEIIPDSSPLWWSAARREELCQQMSERHQTALEQMKRDDAFQYGTIYRRMRKARSMAELRTDGIAGCLRTPRGGSSKQILIRAAKGRVSVRWMTPREYARLQGVPDSFALPDNSTRALFGLGDAVCVPAITWISKHILTPYHKAFHENQSRSASCSRQVAKGSSSPL